MGDGAKQVRAGTGLSGDRDAFEAGRVAATAALAPLAGEPPALVLAFATPRYDLPRLLAGIRSAIGGALLVGCTGSGEIVRGQYLSPHAAALLLTDSLLGDLQQFAQGVYRVTGPRVALVGGAAGDEQRFVASSLFHGDAVLDKGALVLWVASEEPLRVITRHGWEPLGPPLLVTRTEGTEIVELGGRPAAAVYVEQLDLPSPVLGSREVLGVLVLARCVPTPFSRADVELLAAMALRIGLVLARARAEEVRQQLEAGVRQAQKAESLGRMAGAVAHRFNNMLAAATGHLEVAVADLPPGDEAAVEIAQALASLREASHLSSLLRAYLGQGNRGRQPLDLVALCRESLQALRASVPGPVRLRTALPDGPLTVVGDAAGLEGILANLVVNAREAIAEALAAADRGAG